MFKFQSYISKIDEVIRLQRMWLKRSIMVVCGVAMIRTNVDTPCRGPEQQQLAFGLSSPRSTSFCLHPAVHLSHSPPHNFSIAAAIRERLSQTSSIVPMFASGFFPLLDLRQHQSIPLH